MADFHFNYPREDPPLNLIDATWGKFQAWHNLSDIEERKYVLLCTVTCIFDIPRPQGKVAYGYPTQEHGREEEDGGSGETRVRGGERG